MVCQLLGAALDQALAFLVWPCWCGQLVKVWATCVSYRYNKDWVGLGQGLGWGCGWGCEATQLMGRRRTSRVDVDYNRPCG